MWTNGKALNRNYDSIHVQKRALPETAPFSLQDNCFLCKIAWELLQEMVIKPARL